MNSYYIPQDIREKYLTKEKIESFCNKYNYALELIPDGWSIESKDGDMMCGMSYVDESGKPVALDELYYERCEGDWQSILKNLDDESDGRLEFYSLDYVQATGTGLIKDTEEEFRKEVNANRVNLGLKPME